MIMEYVEQTFPPIAEGAPILFSDKPAMLAALTARVRELEAMISLLITDIAERIDDRSPF